MNTTINEIIGLTPSYIRQTDEEIVMQFTNGASCKWYHSQDCCESVTVNDVVGDFGDLLHHPILVAEERVCENENADYEHETWTFYAFRSMGGSVDVRWLGSSNGYYSESVDFTFTPALIPDPEPVKPDLFAVFRAEIDAKFHGGLAC